MHTRHLRPSLLALISLTAFAVPVAPRPPDLFPAAGAVVPRNTKVWVFDASATVQLFGPLGTEVTVNPTRLNSGLVMLTPVSELVPGRYEIRTGLDAPVVFTVTTEVDTEPPAVPVTAVSTTGKVGNIDSTVTVTSPVSSDSFLVVLAENDIWGRAAVLAASARGAAHLAGVAVGETRFKALSVDAAGNASEAIVVATVPPARACSVGPLVPLSMLALLLLRRGRRSAPFVPSH